ncbi:hypothetical protein QI155_03325 [Thermodesulfovibrio sp. 1176]|uniref:hypothetical protein n=1 Tax=Thermodesulfovibrio sp. 1176 TaxID=3043424 RepID=UPI0024825FEB|nr:hypothetical protein [Thermodesulfovibrio sp. 1176]MDI1471555.1 hypothetical protein [Thermodesulfovibrio sp. 1176]
MQQKRNSVSKIHRYLPLDLNTSKPLKAFKRTIEVNFETEYGSHENYQIAKTCCNWETKQKSGYCITLYEPYFLFKKACKDCHILEMLKMDVQKRQAQKKLKKESALYIVET